MASTSVRKRFASMAGALANTFENLRLEVNRRRRAGVRFATGDAVAGDDECLACRTTDTRCRRPGADRRIPEPSLSADGQSIPAKLGPF
jgi:hypothetical protein